MEPMDDESEAILMYHQASNKFEDEFEFSKMETMIHRFPAGLGDGMSTRYPHMVVPRLVAIGPYHHGSNKRLDKMEEVKEAAVYYLWERTGLGADKARKAVLAVVDDARARYYWIDDVETTAFADMMFRDACFLLLYMDFYHRSYGKDEDDNVNKHMRRFLFSNRDSIDHDILLLENQLPWLVIRALIDNVLQQDSSSVDLVKAVGEFIADKGDSFNISEYCKKPEPYKWDDESNPPAHLLALLRRYKTENTYESVGNSNHHLPASAPSTMHDPLVLPSSSASIPPPSASPTTVGGKPSSISSMSPMDLEEIGIKVTASQTEKFSDMSLEKAGPLLSRLTLAPLSLSDTRAAWLVNMAALEICTASRYGDPTEKTAVCSYLALLAFFMAGTDDVRGLRSKGLLHGLHSDDDMLAFFKTVVKHLPDCGKQFTLVMVAIEEYKQQRYIMTTFYRWVYRNQKTIGTVMSIIVGLIGLYKAFLSLVHSK